MVSAKIPKVLAVIALVVNLIAVLISVYWLIQIWILIGWIIIIPFIGIIILAMILGPWLLTFIFVLIFTLILPLRTYRHITPENPQSPATIFAIGGIIGIILGAFGLFPNPLIAFIFLAFGPSVLFNAVPQLIGGIFLVIAGALSLTVEEEYEPPSPTEEPKVSTSTPETEKSEVARCQSCGSELSENEKFCRNCGAEV